MKVSKRPWLTLARPFAVTALVVLVGIQLHIGQLANYGSTVDWQDRPWILQRHASALNRDGCHIAVVSTFTPQPCGIATFTAKLISAMHHDVLFQQRCSLEVFSLVSLATQQNRSLWLPPSEDPLIPVTYVMMDRRSPSRAVWAAVRQMRRHRVTHCVLQQEYGLTPTMWQLADLVRWMQPSIPVYTVVHSPRSHPTVEELGLIRRLASLSKFLVVMSWHAKHSLEAAYGVDTGNVVFIPHGVVLLEGAAHRRTQQSADGSAAAHVLTNGLIHANKGLSRLVQAMPGVIADVPEAQFFVVGREHPNSKHPVMPPILQMVQDYGVTKHFHWVNSFQTEAQLDSYFQQCAVYVTLFDEITPTSGTLLTAMAHGVPVISTPYQYAEELLSNGRGLIVPFDDPAALVAAITMLLRNSSMRLAMGQRAQQFVAQWQWRHVAKAYMELLLSPSPPPPLTPDPFAGAPQQAFSAEWSDQHAVAFGSTGPMLPTKIPNGTYCLYVDHCIQVNAVLDVHGNILSAGLQSQQLLILMHQHSLDVDYGHRNGSCRPVVSTIDYALTRVCVEAGHVTACLAAKLGRITFSATVRSVYASPRGLVGSFFQCLSDGAAPCFLNKKVGQNPSDWQLSDPSVFASDCPGQLRSVFGVTSNVYRPEEAPLPIGVFSNKQPERRLAFRLEGALFDESGFAEVNRRMFLIMSQAPAAAKYNTLLSPTDQRSTLERAQRRMEAGSMGVAEYLAMQAYRRQVAKPTKQGRRKRKRKPTPAFHTQVVFRNSWPPIWSNPGTLWSRLSMHPATLWSRLTMRVIWIHQQPWEFAAIPSEWLPPLAQADALWVPSRYCQAAYVSNGLPPTKVRLVPHGVSFHKWQGFNSSTHVSHVSKELLLQAKRFKFLFIGGLLPRKGIDVLLKAYGAAFTAADDVSLIIHSVYGDGYGAQTIAQEKERKGAAHIVHNMQPLTWPELAQIMWQSDVYVSPYRSEGFGLTILEAMAADKPVVVPKNGPALEISSDEAGWYINVTHVNCTLPPCGRMQMFGMRTVFQPSWADPSSEHLTRILQDAHAAGIASRVLSARARAKEYDWAKAASTILDELDWIGTQP